MFNLLNGFSVAHDYRGSDKKCANCDYGRSDADLQMYPFKQSLPGNVTALQIVESMVQGMYEIGKNFIRVCVSVQAITFKLLGTSFSVK